MRVFKVKLALAASILLDLATFLLLTMPMFQFLGLVKKLVVVLLLHFVIPLLDPLFVSNE